MTEQERKRIEMMDKITNDQNLLSVSDVCEIFSNTLSMQIKKTNTFKNVKKKLTEEEWIKFLSAIIVSFFSSLYCSAANDEEQFKERTKYVTEINKDILVGVALKEVNDKEGVDA